MTPVPGGLGEPPPPPVALQQPPGEGFRLSFGDYVVLQQLLLDATKRPFDDLAAELVLKPLGMTHSTFQQPLKEPLAASAAAGHDARGKPIAEKGRVYPEQAAAGLWTTAGAPARL